MLLPISPTKHRADAVMMNSLQVSMSGNAFSEFGDGGGSGASSKVDRLGAVLKSGVSRLRGRAEADLVFLVDSSASVGAENFHNEIKFVRKVRADQCD